MSRPVKPLAERFWAKVSQSDGCWLWVGALYPDGYGRATISHTKYARAHRVSWDLTHGPIPDGRVVCHRCDVPACVRPDHLFVGTQSDNIRDADAKGRTRRWNRAVTHCRRGHPLSGENLYTGTAGKRVCLTCYRARRAGTITPFIWPKLDAPLVSSETP